MQRVRILRLIIQSSLILEVGSLLLDQLRNAFGQLGEVFVVSCALLLQKGVLQKLLNSKPLFRVRR